MNNLLRLAITTVFALFIVSPRLTAQVVTESAFGMHVRCTPTMSGQNADCTSPTSWPAIPEAPDPSHPFGSMRFHDNGAKWGNIQTRQRADCNASITSGCAWGAFDQWIREARRHKVELLYTFSKTPEWACSKHHGCASSDVPEDAAFSGFAKAVRDRQVDGRPAGCRDGDESNSGCIRNWEVWNEPNNGKSAWCGSIGDMVHLARLVREIVSATDSRAKVVSPGVGYTAGYDGNGCNAGGISGAEVCSRWGRGNGNPEAYICEFLRQNGSSQGDRAGRNYVDIIGWHAYPTNSNLQSMAEEAITRRVPNIQSAMRDNGLSVCSKGRTNDCNELWITETSWGSVSQRLRNGNELNDAECDSPKGCPRINPQNDNKISDCSDRKAKDRFGCWSNDQAAFVAKLYAVALASGVSRTFWYWWDGQPWGTLFCKNPDPITGCSASSPHQLPAAAAFGTVQSWLLGRTIESCGQATDGTWNCNLHDASGKAYKIVWSPTGPKNYSAGPAFTQSVDLYGAKQPISNPMKIGYSPILLQAR